MSKTVGGLESSIFIEARERDPLRAATASGKPKLPKRFYAAAAAAPVAGGFSVLLDGKPVRTPARQALTLPTMALAQAIAAEWTAQGEFIDPGAMRLTKLANSAIDGVAAQAPEVEADIVKYAGSDLICYRAEEPESLVRAQAQAWDPLLHLAREKWDARLILCAGVIFHPQPAPALAAVAAQVRAHVGEGPAAPFRLAALHAMTTLAGSCVIALAAAMGEIDADSAFAAANVDEDHQMRVWGADEEALVKRGLRLEEMRAQARLCALLDGAADQKA